MTTPTNNAAASLLSLRDRAVALVTHDAGAVVPESLAAMTGAAEINDEVRMLTSETDMGWSEATLDALYDLRQASYDLRFGLVAPAAPVAAPAATGLASRVAIYEIAALGDAPFPGIPGCTMRSATCADMALSRRRDETQLREVLRAAGVSL